ncbi:probable 39S ribosomal protein L24, mitochondrial [Orussus abietinus]|uniref:probable 39S ribosomal protein L24, mitochondrial n=1 Tax=Orussus abietinus TaxID=222816 RepID=UPI000624F829|nr:probable 39S ribosomal protein L24, mitochondrial [Orussus abietinus]
MRLYATLLSRMGELSKKYSNLPDSYIKRVTEQVYWRTPKGPQYLPRTIEKTDFRFTTNRPWTQEFRQQNKQHERRKFVHVEPLKDWNFFRGDRVEVLVGHDKGKQGIVKMIFQERNWVIVEGLNTVLKRVGKIKEFPGMLVKFETPLLVTTGVKLVDPSDLQATDIEWKYDNAGVRVRVSTRTGRIIPIPIMNQETIDYKTPRLYKLNDKDTHPKEITKITFKPSLKTFEMDLMDKMGIKEERHRKPTYWY